MGFVPGCDPSYAGRIPAAGRSPAEVQQTIQARLANRALQPQAIVVVEKSFANTVTVTGEVVAGAQVPLSTGGDRLLEVIAAAGGAKAPVYETFVRLSRGGVTATMPLQQLVSDPAENIYAMARGCADTRPSAADLQRIGSDRPKRPAPVRRGKNLTRRGAREIAGVAG